MASDVFASNLDFKKKNIGKKKKNKRAVPSYIEFSCSLNVDQKNSGPMFPSLPGSKGPTIYTYITHAQGAQPICIKKVIVDI